MQNLRSDGIVFRYCCSIIRPKQIYVMLPVTRTTLIFDPSPKVFIKIFLFVISNPALIVICMSDKIGVIRCVV